MIKLMSLVLTLLLLPPHAHAQSQQTTSSLLPAGLANSMLILGFGAILMWCCSLAWRYKMITMLREAQSEDQVEDEPQGIVCSATLIHARLQIIRVDSAADYIATREIAIRASQALALIRNSAAPGAVVRTVPITEIQTFVDIKHRLTKRTDRSLYLVIQATIGFSISSVRISNDKLGQFICRYGGFVDLDRLLKDRHLPPVHYAAVEGDITVELDVTAYGSRGLETMTLIVAVEQDWTGGAGSARSVQLIMFTSDSALMRRHMLVVDKVIMDMLDVWGQDEDGDCSVCLTNPKDVVLMPCLHLSTCAECNRMLDRCPVCRAPIESFITDAFDTISPAPLTVRPGISQIRP